MLVNRDIQETLWFLSHSGNVPHRIFILEVSSTVLSNLCLSSVIVSLIKRLSVDGLLEAKIEKSTDASSGQHSQAVLNTYCMAQNSNYDDTDFLSSSEDSSAFLDVVLNTPFKYIDKKLMPASLREGSLPVTFSSQKNNKWGPIANARK